MRVMMLNRVEMHHRVYPAGTVHELTDKEAKALIAAKAAMEHKGDESDDDEILDYESMTSDELYAALMKKNVDDLKGMLDENSIEYGAKDKKADLVNLLLKAAGKDPVEPK